MAKPDYQSLIDAQTWAFIRKTAEWYPDDATDLSIEGQREVYDRMCRAFHQGYPPGITVSDRPMGDVPCRVYTPASARADVTVVYFHGGGFVVGGLHSHDDVCAEICQTTGLRVVSVDYRLAPEHVHPAHFEDCRTATLAVAAEFGGALLLAGDSAGGALAAAVSHALRGQGVTIRGQVLIYPGLGGDRDRGSYLTHAEAPMLTRADVLFYERIRHGGPAPARDPTAAVLQDDDFTGLPPTLIIAAECDPLASDAETYATRIRDAGGTADWVVEPGLVHGYLRARHSVDRARASFARITGALTRMASA